MTVIHCDGTYAARKIHCEHRNGGVKTNLESNDTRATLNNIPATAVSNWFAEKFSGLRPEYKGFISIVASYQGLSKFV